MKLQIFTLPTDPSLIPDWLEQQIVGTALAQLIAELHAVHGGRQQQKLIEITGPSHPSLLQIGLRALSENQIQRLLQNPSTLGELQEEVFVGGYPYWARIAESGRASSLADLILQRRFLPHALLESSTDAGLSSRTAEELSITEPIAQTPTLPEATQVEKLPANPDPRSPSRHCNSRRRGRLLLILSPALIAAIAAFVIFPGHPAETAWGFQRDNLLAAELPESDFFSSLAVASAEWFVQDRTTPTTLRRSLHEFSAGCNALIAAPLPQLSSEKRRLLREKCRNWQREADSLLVQLDAGNAQLDNLRKSSDALMTRLGNALRRQLNPA